MTAGRPRASDAMTVFVVGCPRSGTTLLQRLLDRHSALAIAPETHFVRRFLKSKKAKGASEAGPTDAAPTRDAAFAQVVDAVIAMPEFGEMGLDAGAFRAAAAAFSPERAPDLRGKERRGALFPLLLEHYRALRGKRVAGEKTPNHLLYMQAIGRLFPGARFVRLVRDPRAVAASWRNVPWSTGSLEGDAGIWCKYERAAAARDRRLLTIRYEDLVREPEPVLRRVCAFLDLPYESALLDERAPAGGGDASPIDAAREPWKERALAAIDPSLADAWERELSPSDVKQVERVARPFMAAHGYWPRKFGASFLLIGDETDGLHRYGRLLADAMDAADDVTVARAAVSFDDASGASGHALDDALARLLPGADALFVQYNPRVFGGGASGWLVRARVKHVLERCRAAGVLEVVTLHDVYPEDPWLPFKKRRASLALRLRRRWRDVRERLPARLALAELIERAAVVVHSAHERERLAAVAAPDAVARVAIVPHFVERLPPLPARDAAKRLLGLAGRRVVCVLGFVHPRKGHEIALEALALLPGPLGDVTLVCAGAPSRGSEAFARRLERRAAKLGLADRFRVTGWLDAPRQAEHLAAADLALCPFRFFSASGSLSTWIAAGRRVLCHDLPQIAELRALAEGDTFPTFAPYEPAALAAAIARELDLAAARAGGSAAAEHAALERLAERVAPERIARRYVDLARARLAERRASPPAGTPR